MQSIAGVIRPSNERLIWGVMHNLKPHGQGSTQRWVLVRDTFAVGSTSAYALCKEFGLDPDEEITGSECDYCELCIYDE